MRLIDKIMDLVWSFCADVILPTLLFVMGLISFAMIYFGIKEIIR